MRRTHVLHQNGLGPKWKWLGTVFAVLGAIAAFGIGNIAQVNSIADSVKSVAIAFNEDAANKEMLICLITGICVAIFVALVLLGGVKRIGQVTEKLVPGMAVIYIVCALIVVFANLSAVPGVFASIFKGAFNPAAVTGGAAGMSIKLAMTKGVGRGVFSNEAGPAPRRSRTPPRRKETPSSRAFTASLRSSWTPSSSAR